MKVRLKSKAQLLKEGWEFHQDLRFYHPDYPDYSGCREMEIYLGTYVHKGGASNYCKKFNTFEVRNFDGGLYHWLPCHIVKNEVKLSDIYKEV